MYTYEEIRQRTAYLRGETNYNLDSDEVIENHINASVKDICNSFSFSWNLTTTDITLSSGTANLPSDYNSKWGLYDAREGENIFEQIDIKDRDKFGSADYKYYITYDATNKVYVFNSPGVQSGTVTIYYYFVPEVMDEDTDQCIVPDGEAVAYLAASKMWIGDERNQALKQDYEKEAGARITAMYRDDLNSGPDITQGNIIDYNSNLSGY